MIGNTLVSLRCVYFTLFHKPTCIDQNTCAYAGTSLCICICVCTCVCMHISRRNLAHDKHLYTHILKTFLSCTLHRPLPLTISLSCSRTRALPRAPSLAVSPPRVRNRCCHSPHSLTHTPFVRFTYTYT